MLGDFDTKRIQQLSHVSIEQAVDGIFWLDHQARVLRANNAACRLLGYTENEFLAMSVPDFHINFSI